MARILYTVCGIGLGHATRSTPIIKELMKNHEVFIASYGDAYDFLKKEFRMNEKLNWFKLIYKEDRLRKARTFFYNLPRLPYVATKNLIKAFRLIRRFKPELIISDFDVNGVYMGELFGIPVITITNMHLMNYEKLPMDFNEKIKYYLTEKPVLNAFNSSDYMIISSFVKPKANGDRTYFFNPIVRDLFLEESGVRDEGFFLVYSFPPKLEMLLPLLKRFADRRFVVYGFDKEGEEGNIVFRKFSERGFAENLKKCTAVVTHGGISLLSEAVQLKKPIYVFTTMDFFERYYNAWLIQKLGLGLLVEKATKESFDSFLAGLPEYRKKFESAGINADNGQVIKTIERIISIETKGN